jgi:hypothetical protein
LYRHRERLASADDEVAARALRVAIGVLLDDAPAEEGIPAGDGAAVVDLGAERAKRGGS